MFDNEEETNTGTNKVNKMEIKKNNYKKKSKIKLMFVGICEGDVTQKANLSFVPLLPCTETGWLTLQLWHT